MSNRATGMVGAYAAELVGTFVFTFSGTGTVLAVHRLSHTTSAFTATEDIAIAIAFGFGVLAAVYMAASVSGAHINPAVTVALAAVGEFPLVEVVPYVVSQVAGGLLAALLDWYLFGPTLRHSLILGSTKPGPGVSTGQALVAEIVITAVLMIVVMATAVYKRAPGGATTSGLAIGLWVGAAIFLALPISGASLNPARTIGPDVVALQFPSWWIYVVGPIVGAVAGALIWKLLLARGRPEAVTGDDRAGSSHLP